MSLTRHFSLLPPDNHDSLPPLHRRSNLQTAAEAAGLYSPYVPAVPATDEEPEQPEQPAYYTCYTHDYSMDIVGVIYNNDGVYDDEGEVTPPTLYWLARQLQRHAA